MNDTPATAMTPAALITPSQLRERLGDRTAKTLVIDCSFELADPAAGRRAYDAGHLPGAVYVHLDEVLSAAKTGRNGRHPLPERARFADAMAAVGADDDTFVVGYDNACGMYAARLWWMLRWVGHGATAVLDGGIAAWQAEAGPLAVAAPAARRRGAFSLRKSLVPIVDYQAVKANLDGGQRLLIDARAPDRYRGENETLDPVGGHIPGARNRLFRDNLAADGRFKPAAQLRAEFDRLLDGRPADAVISQCGSGVTACHNLLAMEVAGLPGGKLYAGSWSEWIADSARPRERG
jgi:thiosulfate/3-mercaptopyruvate sulfurtransferase